MKRVVARFAALSVALLIGSTASSAPTFVVRDNRAGLPEPGAVAVTAAALRTGLTRLRLWPSGQATQTLGGTRFVHRSAVEVGLELPVAAAAMRALDGLAGRVHVPDAPDDLLHVLGLLGDSALRRITLFLHFDVISGGREALPLRVVFAADQPDLAGATLRFAASDGFVRRLRLDVVVAASTRPGYSVVGYELDVSTDWRGVAVTRRDFEVEVVRKIAAILKGLVQTQQAQR